MYSRLAGKRSQNISWFDITGKDDELKALGIDPQLALTELHIRIDNSEEYAGAIKSELDAYIILMQRVFWLKPLAALLAMPLLKPHLARAYHTHVIKRLKKQGRL